MKNTLIFLILLLFSISSVFPQEVIENTKNPLNPNAGRVLKIEEVFRITDESGEFYLKYSRNLKVAPDGCIFIDDEDQFLKFSSDGQFIKNLYKKGQGPGEIQESFYYAFHNSDIFIFDPINRKVIHTDKEGKLIDEFKFTDRFRDFYGVLEDKFIFLKSPIPTVVEKKGGIYNVPKTILLVSKDGKIDMEFSGFPARVFIGKVMSSTLDAFRSVLSDDGRTLFVNHTSEYRIVAFDLIKGEITKIFNRKYPRIKLKKREEDVKESKSTDIPEPKFKSDISRLYLFNGNLWIRTSTIDEKRGTLFDVFDIEGKFIDSFFIDLKGGLIGTDRGSLFVLETDENELLSIVKYKVLDKSFFP